MQVQLHDVQLYKAEPGSRTTSVQIPSGRDRCQSSSLINVQAWLHNVQRATVQGQARFRDNGSADIKPVETAVKAHH